MPQLPVTTYQDLIDHLTDWLGGNPSQEAARDSRRAVQNALREFGNAHRWSYYYGRGRVITNGHQNAGTVRYQQSGGSVPYQVTLAGASWPSWVTQGTLLLGQVEYPVAAQVDAQTLQLSDQNNPGADLAAGTSYDLYQDAYPLPTDFVAMDEVINSTYVLGLDFVHPSAWLTLHRLVYSPATPYRYTITGHPNFQGTLCLRLFPAPDSAYFLDFIYQRRARPLLLDDRHAGAATTTAGNQTVQGTATAFDASMVGSVIRFSSSSTPPTGLVGGNPYAVERVITAVASTTQLSVDAALPQSLANVAYRVSDPVDVEEGAMLTAFLRCCEWQLARSRNRKDRQEVEKEYRDSLVRAREADSRSFQARASGVYPASRLRKAYMPAGPDLG